MLPHQPLGGISSLNDHKFNDHKFYDHNLFLQENGEQMELSRKMPSGRTYKG
jgi:hypothetical protein